MLELRVLHATSTTMLATSCRDESSDFRIAQAETDWKVAEFQTSTLISRSHSCTFRVPERCALGATSSTAFQVKMISAHADVLP
jgi:hypothetical protein